MFKILFFTDFLIAALKRITWVSSTSTSRVAKDSCHTCSYSSKLTCSCGWTLTTSLARTLNLTSFLCSPYWLWARQVQMPTSDICARRIIRTWSETDILILLETGFKRPLVCRNQLEKKCSQCTQNCHVHSLILKVIHL